LILSYHYSFPLQESKTSETQGKLRIFEEMEKQTNRPRTKEKQESFISNQARLKMELKKTQKDYSQLQKYALSTQNATKRN
jgi:hypothetical protein